MLLKREGFPEEGEFVLCTVNNIQYNSVFVKLNEYGRTGLIHISEISPGRIRNIRDYVIEGKIVVCVVLNVNKERGYIDLSLRRVNEMEKKKKLERIKQEQKAEKILENFSIELKKPIVDLYPKIATPILKQFDYVHSAFQEVVERNVSLASFGVPQEIAEKLDKIIIEKVKPKSVIIEGSLHLVLYTPNGVETLQNVLHAAEDAQTAISYEGRGRYRVLVTAKEYKTAEKTLKEKLDGIQKGIEGAKGTFAFDRLEKK
ncbi:S1 RNA-binding domain-containing protein [Candidatus Woesearchaeota archaeon]|nr:MAG: S1 RNA-binding domain-containing protein [Candidatus Woesearchaeota archaeon]